MRAQAERLARAAAVHLADACDARGQESMRRAIAQAVRCASEAAELLSLDGSDATASAVERAHHWASAALDVYARRVPACDD